MQRIFSLRFGKLLLAIGCAGGAVVLLLRKPALPELQTNSVELSTRQSTQAKHTPATATRLDNLFPAPAESSTDDELLQLAREAVVRSPEDALEWARSVTDSSLRQRLLLAVLRAWGEIAPKDALAWVLQHENDQQLFGVESASNTRELWFRMFFDSWTTTNPEEAAKALASIEDPELRTQAFDSIVGHWAMQDSAGLAAFAVTLPSGEERAQTLSAALNQWTLNNPAEAAEWLNSLPPSPELDASIAALVHRTDSANRSPETAMSWVESIADSELRRDSLMTVAFQWAESDPAAAEKYVQNVPWLTVTQRDAIVRALKPVPKIASDD